MDDARRARGRLGERLAAAYLELAGYTILGRNMHWADVEVDLVVRRAERVALVEVKLLQNGLQAAKDELRPAQHQRLRRAAGALLAQHPGVESVRLDVIGIDWRGDELRLLHVRGVA